MSLLLSPLPQVSHSPEILKHSALSSPWCEQCLLMLERKRAHWEDLRWWDPQHLPQPLLFSVPPTGLPKGSALEMANPESRQPIQSPRYILLGVKLSGFTLDFPQAVY